MSARQGKIARLPAAIRAELNQRILDGQSGRKILAWLNNLPEVQRILEEDAEGLRVSDSNLTHWRQGGFEDWRKQRERIERTKELADYSVKIAAAGGGQLTEGAAAILSGKVLEQLELIDELLGRGPTAADSPSPALEPAAIAALTESLKSLGETLANLRTGDQNNRRLSQNDEKLEILRQRLKQTEEQLRQAKQKLEFDAAKACLKVLPQLKAIAADNSLDENAKIDQARQVLFGMVAE